MAPFTTVLITLCPSVEAYYIVYKSCMKRVPLVIRYKNKVIKKFFKTIPHLAKN